MFDPWQETFADAWNGSTDSFLLQPLGGRLLSGSTNLCLNQFSYNIEPQATAGSTTSSYTCMKKQASVGWSMVHNVDEGYLDCPHLTANPSGKPLAGSCGAYGANKQGECQSDCLLLVPGCNGINFRPSDGQCCFKSCSDRAAPHLR